MQAGEPMCQSPKQESVIFLSHCFHLDLEILQDKVMEREMQWKHFIFSLCLSQDELKLYVDILYPKQQLTKQSVILIQPVNSNSNHLEFKKWGLRAQVFLGFHFAQSFLIFLLSGLTGWVLGHHLGLLWGSTQLAGNLASQPPPSQHLHVLCTVHRFFFVVVP